jgi:MFS transporter, DHA1 family, tetracycline resistance protein
MLAACSGAPMLLRLQVFFVQPLLSAVGEKRTLVISHVATTLKFLGLGLVGSKAGVYGTEVLGCLAFISTPTVLSITANAVEEHEQGAVQGALSGVQSLAEGCGPLIFMQIYRLCTTTIFMPRVRFFARRLLLVPPRLPK